MAIDYFARLPRLLQDEFSAGRWLPIVGAGISANARTRTGKQPPAWKELGEAVRQYLPDGYGVDGPVDAISTYEQMHGRPALIDCVHDALLIDEARPAEVHKAFARIPFDTVLTTNVDFILETAWSAIGWPFDPVVGEQRLASKRRARRTQLVKFHGDIYHPNELVLTEEDYDNFLIRFPLLATYVASLLITRVPVLFGYSLEDPDFRAILQLLGERLGRNRPAPWVILARGTRAQVARYERRGVRVVVLDTRFNTPHGPVLAALFQQLADRLPKVAGARADSSEDQILAELRLAGPNKGALALFLGRNEYLAQHRDLLFPALRATGLAPVTPDEIQTASELRLAALTQLVRRAAVIVVDQRGAGRFDDPLSFVLSQGSAAPIIVISDELSAPVSPTLAAQSIIAPTSGAWDDELINAAAKKISEAAQRDESRGSRILARLQTGDVTFAFLEAVIAVESTLRSSDAEHRNAPYRQLFHEHPALNREDEALLRTAYTVRNQLLHRGVEPPEKDTRELTLQLLAILDRLGG
ncbi:MAG: SIR2 family NAD-dependent protein deacylase [Frankiaceae bacterium]